MSSLWDQKPWWCQPWSIVLTGVTAIALSWLLFHLIWLTALVTTGVIVWWWLFLVLVPTAFEQAEQETSDR